MYPSITVIVPFYRDLDHFEQCLNCLENQTIGTSLFEIIIIDNHPEPSGIDPGKANIKCIHEPLPGSYNARNAALKLVPDGIVAFTDADCLAEPDWLERGIQNLTAHEEMTIIAGAIKLFASDSENHTLVEDYDILLGLRQKRYVESYKFCATANMILWRSAFDNVGMFDGSLKSGGDREWGARAHNHGYKVLYSDNVIVNHPARRTAREIILKTRRVEGGVYDTEGSGSLSGASMKDKFLLSIESLILLLSSGNLSVKRKLELMAFILYLYSIQIFERLKLLTGGQSER